MNRGLLRHHSQHIPMRAAVLLFVTLNCASVSAFAPSVGFASTRFLKFGLSKQSNGIDSSILQAPAFSRLHSRPESTLSVSMKLKNFAKIGKQIPVTWKEGAEYARSPKYAIGDLVILLRSDGKLRYGEIVNQVGLPWQNSWEVAVSVSADGSPSATRSEKASSMWKETNAANTIKASTPTGSKSAPVQVKTQTMSRTAPPTAKAAAPPPAKAAASTSRIPTRGPVGSVRSVTQPAKPAPKTEAKKDSGAAGATTSSSSPWSFFSQITGTTSKPADPPTPPPAAAPAPAAPTPTKKAAQPTAKAAQPTASASSFVDSFFSKIPFGAAAPAAAPEPPKPAPPAASPTPPPAAPAAAENPVAALFSKFGQSSVKPAAPPAAKPAAAPPAANTPASAPPPGSRLVTLPRGKPAAAPAAPAAPAAKTPPAAATTTTTPAAGGSSNPAAAVSSLFGKITAADSPVSSIVGKLSEVTDSAAKAAKAAVPARKAGEPDPAAMVADAGKSAMLGFLSGLSKVVDSLAEEDKVAKPAKKEPSLRSSTVTVSKDASSQPSAAAPAASKPAAAAGGELSPTEAAKRLAGYKAVDDHVRSGMVVGLGTGSTAYYAVERVGQKLASGELTDIVCIPTSERTRQQAESLRIPLCTLDERSELDVAIDGADAVDPNLALVKGGGGALLREKMVEVRAKRFICIVDESKLCKGLGPSFPLPVEITPFCDAHTLREVEALPAVAGCRARLRTGDVSSNKGGGDKPAVTDNGNYIVDLSFDQPIADVRAAAYAIKDVVGVVDHGLFVDMAYQVIVAGKDGTCRVAGRGGEAPWW